MPAHLWDKPCCLGKLNNDRMEIGHLSVQIVIVGLKVNNILKHQLIFF